MACSERANPYGRTNSYGRANLLVSLFSKFLVPGVRTAVRAIFIQFVLTNLRSIGESEGSKVPSKPSNVGGGIGPLFGDV